MGPRESVHPKLRIVAAVAAALLIGPALAGCSAEAVGGAVNGAVQGATGGEVSLGGKLPASWPDTVPVVAGKLLLGAANTTDGKQTWVVTVVSDSPDALAEVTTSLTDAGFVPDESPSATVGAAGVVSMKSASHSVVVVGSDTGLLYTVTALP